MNLRQATVHVINAASAAALETAVNTFLKDAGQKELLSISFTESMASVIDSTNVVTTTASFTAYIVYTQ